MAEDTRVPLRIQQGATFRRRVTVAAASGDPVDLTGFTARMQVREDYPAETVMLEASTDDGRITVDGPAGVLWITVPPTATAALPRYGFGVYDLELVSPDGGDVRRILEGDVEVTPEVTR